MEEGGSDGEEGLRDEEEQVRRRIQLFHTPGIQLCLRRLWLLLPKDDAGLLALDGYVEFNLRLQKCLSPGISTAAAAESAVGDWCEDVPEGQEFMTEQDFAMSFFELSSRWCGPTVSLLVHLHFLCAVFVGSTEAQGINTIGLRPLEDVELLPKSFFELLSAQGWAKLPEDMQQMTEAEAHEVWEDFNISPEAQRSALAQVQRQVFQITHDARAALFFRDLDGRQLNDPSVMEILKFASRQLDRVSKEEPRRRALALPPVSPTGHRVLRALNDFAPLPWCPPMHARFPGLNGAAASAKAATSSATLVPTKASHSASRHTRGSSMPAVRRSTGQQPEPVPVGRAFETRRASSSGRGRGLALAGRAAVSAGSAGEGDLALTEQTAALPPSTPPQPAASAAKSQASSELDGEGGKDSAHEVPAEDDKRLEELLVQRLAEGMTFPPCYTLPKKPGDVYHKQAEPWMQVDAGTLVFQTNRWQAENSLVTEPFKKSLAKLPMAVNPGPEGPLLGPLLHPTEPVWTELNGRLHAILRRQGKRADRRRKRRLRAKMLAGRAKGGKRDESRGLREYFDREVMQRAEGQVDPTEKDDFMKKVHEQQLRRREGLGRRCKQHQAPEPPWPFKLPNFPVPLP